MGNKGDVTPQRGQRTSPVVQAGQLTGLGFEFAGTVIAGVVVGYYLDSRLETEPLFTILVTLAAMVGAVYRLIWSLKRFSSQAGNTNGPRARR